MYVEKVFANLSVLLKKLQYKFWLIDYLEEI